MLLFSSPFLLFSFQSLKDLDRRLLVAINHAHTPALDAIMTFASNRYVWFPAYALLIIWLIYYFRRQAVLLLPLVIAAVSLADSITSRLFKPFFARPRPCHDGVLAYQLHLPDGCGGQFGFLSSHAANSMALAIFLLLVLPASRLRGLKTGAFIWAGLLSYSRIYLGAHYPTDVLGGAAVGALLAWLAALAYQTFSPKMSPKA
ncbi:phosphatase PAP2 family protein [Hymenobacter terrenus]|uniref:phosphatase PAP2 family protein n=1 Tax=Hymenobacter terrenus TaxID=1629124 RepID=UPI000619B552|nr:phosphatase PAP2 family protein [Hymenobacter terrenus]